MTVEPRVGQLPAPAMRGASAVTGESAGSAPQERARGMVGLLFDRDFGLLTWGKFFSVTAVWTHSVVAAIAVYVATGSTFAVGLVAVVQFTPQLVFTPMAGTWADRGNVKAQLLLGRLMSAVATIGIGLVYWLAAPTGWSAAAAVLAASLLLGLGFVVGGPAMHSVVPELVTREELPAAMALNSAPVTIARFLGPMVGALLVSEVSVTAGFLMASTGHLVFLAALAAIRIPARVVRTEEVDFSVAAGVRYVLGDRTVRLLLCAVAAVGFASEPTLTLAPALADALGGGTTMVGVLTSGFGIGAILGLIGLGTLTARVAPERFTMLGLALVTCGALLAALLPWAVAVMVGFAFVGAGFTVVSTAVATAIQLHTPDYLRGRVMALWMVGFVGARPVAAVVVGLVTDLSTVHLAVLVTGLPTLVALIACWRGRLWGRRARVRTD
ncbi:MFS transporter [Nocardioides sp. AE5]|uniref:MFS transporter n=1 Tax=Nocardioides sp. AE5 TaxID=2962573 RepID=UPI002881E3F3|nr:MFS transporter [Nocardioides sp. AE5]MDT0202698.1 MFS transporter [Nocardioides sp. AE5]